jgi:hypothetical protein
MRKNGRKKGGDERERYGKKGKWAGWGDKMIKNEEGIKGG